MARSKETGITAILTTTITDTDTFMITGTITGMTYTTAPVRPGSLFQE
ncbi:hypothetical protein [Cognatiyoonia sp. IB215182]